MSKGGEDVTVASPVTLSLARSFFSLFLFHRVSWAPTALATFPACARLLRPSPRALVPSRSCLLSSKVSHPRTACSPRMLRVCAFSRLLSRSFPFVFALVEAYTPHLFDSFVRSERLSSSLSHIQSRNTYQLLSALLLFMPGYCRETHWR